MQYRLSKIQSLFTYTLSGYEKVESPQQQQLVKPYTRKTLTATTLAESIINFEWNSWHEPILE